MHIRAVDHRVWISEAGAKRFADRHTRDQRLVECVVHHHFVGIDGATARLRADAERVEGRESVRPELDAGAYLAELRCLLQYLDREATTRERERGREAADAAAGDQHRQRRGSVVHGAPPVERGAVASVDSPQTRHPTDYQCTDDKISSILTIRRVSSVF